MQDTDKQSKNSERTAGLKPYQWKPGQSGNPNGRPKEKTLKEYVKEMLERMPDNERDAFLVGMPKLDIWKMAEGNPHTTEDKRIEIAQPTPILGGVSNATHIEAVVKEAISDSSGTDTAS